MKDTLDKTILKAIKSKAPLHVLKNDEIVYMQVILLQELMKLEKTNENLYNEKTESNLNYIIEEYINNEQNFDTLICEAIEYCSEEKNIEVLILNAKNINDFNIDNQLKNKAKKAPWGAFYHKELIGPNKYLIKLVW